MKKLSAILATLLLAAVSATPALAAIEVTGDAYVGYFSKYVWRGFDLSGGLPVVQGGVDLSAKGFTLSYWTNVQTKNDDIDNDGVLDLDGGEANETDITLNYAIPVGDIATVNVGNIYYTFDSDSVDDTNELYVGATLNTLLSPSVKVYYDWDEDNENAVDGENSLFYTASISHSLPVGDMVTLGASALVGYNDENPSVDVTYHDWHNYELSAKADIKIMEQLTITPSITFSEPISDDARLAIDSQLYSGINVFFTF